MQQLALNHWYSREDINGSSIAEPSRLWLAHVGSMTRLIKQHIKAEFELKVVRELVSEASERECELLNLSSNTVYVREIVMYADGQPWLYARSVFPQQVLDLTDKSLKELGDQPLGRLFFHSESDISGKTNPRQSIEIGYVSADHELLNGESFPETAEQALYARRSTFNYHDMPALVQEVFLPAHPIYQS